MEFSIEKKNEKKQGIYIIKSKVSDDFYIGSTRCFKDRLYKYIHSFTKNRKCGKLGRFVQKHGLNSVRMEMLEIISDLSLLTTREYELIGELKPTLNSKLKKTDKWLIVGNGWDGKTHKAETKEKIRNSMKKSAVIMMNMAGEQIKEFISIREASRKTGLHPQHISGCCRGVSKSTGGFTFKYK